MTMLNAARVWISKTQTCMTAYNYQIPTKKQTGVLQLDFPNVHLVKGPLGKGGVTRNDSHDDF